MPDTLAGDTQAAGSRAASRWQTYISSNPVPTEVSRLPLTSQAERRRRALQLADLPPPSLHRRRELEVSAQRGRPSLSSGRPSLRPRPEATVPASRRDAMRAACSLRAVAGPSRCIAAVPAIATPTPRRSLHSTARRRKTVRRGAVCRERRRLRAQCLPWSLPRCPCSPLLE